MRITGYLMIRLNDCDEGKDFCPDREILDVRRKLRYYRFSVVEGRSIAYLDEACPMMPRNTREEI